MRKQMLCKNCGFVGAPKKKAKGSFKVELSLLLLPVLIFIIYFIQYREEYGLSFEDFLILASCDPNIVPVLDGSFALFWTMALIYAIWRFMTKRPICPSCGAENCFLPVDSPIGRSLLQTIEKQVG